MFDMAEIKKQMADVKDSMGDNIKQNFYYVCIILKFRVWKKVRWVQILKFMPNYTLYFCCYSISAVHSKVFFFLSVEGHAVIVPI